MKALCACFYLVHFKGRETEQRWEEEEEGRKEAGGTKGFEKGDMYPSKRFSPSPQNPSFIYHSALLWLPPRL